jgi:hypothetical protein
MDPAILLAIFCYLAIAYLWHLMTRNFLISALWAPCILYAALGLLLIRLKILHKGNKYLLID